MNPMMLKGARCCTDHHDERSQVAKSLASLAHGNSPRSTEPFQVAESREDVAAPEQAGSCKLPDHGLLTRLSVAPSCNAQSPHSRNAVLQPQARALLGACLQRVVSVCDGHFRLIAPHHIHTQLHTFATEVRSQAPLRRPAACTPTQGVFEARGERIA